MWRDRPDGAAFSSVPLWSRGGTGHLSRRDAAGRSGRAAAGGAGLRAGLSRAVPSREGGAELRAGRPHLAPPHPRARPPGRSAQLSRRGETGGRRGRTDGAQEPASPSASGVRPTVSDGARPRLSTCRQPPAPLTGATMESPAGGSAATELAHPCAEPELPAAGPAEAVAGGGEVAQVGAAAPRPRCLRAVYVLNDPPKGGAGARSPEAGARQCLLRACEAEGAQLGTVNFGELDFGETEVLDAFYDAGEQLGGGGAGGRELRLTPVCCHLPGLREGAAGRGGKADRGGAGEAREGGRGTCETVRGVLRKWL